MINYDFFENVIILKALTDASYISTVSPYLDPKFFHDTNNKVVVKLLKEFFDRRGKIPTSTEIKTLIIENKEQEAYKKVITTLKGLDKNIDEDELYDNTEKFFREKQVLFTILEASELIGKPNTDLEQIANKFQSALSISLNQSIGFNLREDIEQFVEELQQEQSTISTGWKWLDEKIEGGFLEKGKALYVFCGITNIGKSIFLGGVATAIAKQNKNVLLISLEMPEHMYTKRICSHITKIPLSEMRANAHIIPEHLEDSLISTSGNILIKEFPPSTITTSQLDAYITHTKKKYKVDAIVLDYVNLLKGTFGNNSYERVKDVTEKLRALSYTHNCPIISATQLGRAATDSVNPGLDTISESFGLAATADCLFNIWQEEEDAELGIIRMGIIKNRFGPRGVATPLKIDYRTLTITEDSHLTIEDPTDVHETLESLNSLMTGTN